MPRRRRQQEATEQEVKHALHAAEKSRTRAGRRGRHGASSTGAVKLGCGFRVVSAVAFLSFRVDRQIDL
jgi:hypothetical protein